MEKFTQRAVGLLYGFLAVMFLVAWATAFGCGLVVLTFGIHFVDWQEIGDGVLAMVFGLGMLALTLKNL